MERPPGTYVKVLADRRKASSRISRDYQMTGLALAEILKDRSHKHIYLKLAKEYDGGTLLGIAKDVAERAGVKNYGAYFMRRFAQLKANIRRISRAPDMNPRRRRQPPLPLRRKKNHAR